MSYLEGKRGGGGGGAREESREGVDDSELLYALAGAGEHLWGVWFGRESGSRSVGGREVNWGGVRWVNGCEAGELDVEKGKDNQDRALLGNRPPYAHLAPVYRNLPSLAPAHSQ